MLRVRLMDVRLLERQSREQIRLENSHHPLLANMLGALIAPLLTSQ